MVNAINFKSLSSPQKKLQPQKSHSPLSQPSSDVVCFTKKIDKNIVDKPKNAEDYVKHFDQYTKLLWKDACNEASRKNQPLNELHFAKAYIEYAESWGNGYVEFEDYASNREFAKCLPQQYFNVIKNYEDAPKEEFLAQLREINQEIDNEIEKISGSSPEKFEQVPDPWQKMPEAVEPKLIDKFKNIFKKPETPPVKTVAISSELVNTFEKAYETALKRSGGNVDTVQIKPEDLLANVSSELSSKTLDIFNSKLTELDNYLKMDKVDESKIEKYTKNLDKPAWFVWNKATNIAKENNSGQIDQKHYVYAYFNFIEKLSEKIGNNYKYENSEKIMACDKEYIHFYLPELLELLKTGENRHAIRDEFSKIFSVLNDEFNSESKSSSRLNSPSVPTPELIEMFERANEKTSRKIDLNDLITSVSPELASKTIDRFNNKLHELYRNLYNRGKN